MAQSPPVKSRIKDLQNLLGTDGETIIDSTAKASVLSPIGTNSADNAFSSALVAADRDGSVLERTEFLMNQGTSVLAAQNAPTAPTTYFPGLGYHVTKVGDIATVGGTDPIFDITGKVIITMLVGEVTSVVATTTSLQLVSSVGSRVLCVSTDIVTEIANTLYILTGDPDDVLTGNTQNVVGAAVIKTGVHCEVLLNGTVIQQKVDAAGTGLVQWDLYYIPVSSTGSVSASA